MIRCFESNICRISGCELLDNDNAFMYICATILLRDPISIWLRSEGDQTAERYLIWDPERVAQCLWDNQE